MVANGEVGDDLRVFYWVFKMFFWLFLVVFGSK